MNIIDIITLKYPGIQGISHWQTQYDGTPWDDSYEGLVWENTQIAKPTKEELDQWAKDVEQAYQFQQNKIANKSIYDQLDELDLKTIRALRENDSTRLASLEAQAATLRTQLLPTS